MSKICRNVFNYYKLFRSSDVEREKMFAFNALKGISGLLHKQQQYTRGVKCDTKLEQAFLFIPRNSSPRVIKIPAHDDI
jgi:hypothetical protein